MGTELFTGSPEALAARSVVPLSLLLEEHFRSGNHGAGWKLLTGSGDSCRYVETLNTTLDVHVVMFPQF